MHYPTSMLLDIIALVTLINWWDYIDWVHYYIVGCALLYASFSARIIKENVIWSA